MRMTHDARYGVSYQRWRAVHIITKRITQSNSHSGLVRFLSGMRLSSNTRSYLHDQGYALSHANDHSQT